MVLTRVQYSNFAVHKHFLSISDSYIEFSCLEEGGGGGDGGVYYNFS